MVVHKVLEDNYLFRYKNTGDDPLLIRGQIKIKVAKKKLNENVSVKYLKNKTIAYNRDKYKALKTITDPKKYNIIENI